jgi:hypothetical protein
VVILGFAVLEFIAYFCTILLSFLFTMRVRVSDTVFAIFWLAWSVLLSFVIRSNNFDVDMLIYKQNLNYGNYSFYTLREPFLWLGSRLVFSVTQSSITTFVIFDTLSFILILLGLRAIKAPRYYYFLMYIMPFVFFGMQNIYRQYLAMCFVFAAYSLYSKLILKLFLSAVAILSHNASIILLPLVTRRRLGLLYVITMATTLNIVLAKVDVQKSGRTIGLDLTVVFVCLVAFLFIIHNYLKRSYRHTPLFVFSLVFLSLASLHFESSQIERVGYYLLFIMIPIVLTDLDSIVSDVTIFRCTVVLSVVFVMLWFPATMVFIN